jgi:oligopeptide transport system substrate-binding protein
MFGWNLETRGDRAMRRVKPIVPLVLALLLWAGCGRRETPVEAGVRTQTLYVAIPGEPSELDPHIINAPPDFRVAPVLFEGLVSADPNTLQARPGVAERWELSDDRRTYTFHLRRDARWSNGDPVAAQDFLYSFRRALTPELGSQYTFLFSTVVGADDYAAGRLSDFSQVGFAAPDERTVRITLIQPTPHFLEIMANNVVWSPVHPPTIEQAGGIARRGSGWTRPETFVGNGPFTLERWRPNELIVTRKSPTYWNESAIRLSAVQFQPFDNTDAQERAFRAGQLHVTARVPLAKIPMYREQSPSPLHNAPFLMLRMVNLNTSRPPLNDARVRRALALALSRRQLAERVYYGAASPALQIVPDGMPNYTPGVRIEESAEVARALLAEAGFPGGRGFPSLELQVEASASSQLDQALQAAWRQVLGIDVRIVVSESRVHWSNLQQRNYTLSIGGWVADFPDATSMLDLWGRASGWNFTGWNDDAYDAELAAANAAPTPAQRLRHLQAAEAQLLEAMPVVPVWFERDLKLLDHRVRNWPGNAMDRPLYGAVYLEN